MGLFDFRISHQHVRISRSYTKELPDLRKPGNSGYGFVSPFKLFSHLQSFGEACFLVLFVCLFIYFLFHNGFFSQYNIRSRNIRSTREYLHL